MAISLDGIDTTTTWRVEAKDLVMEVAPGWLDDDHDDTPDELAKLDEDVTKATNTKSMSAPPTEATHSQPQSQSKGVRLCASTSNGRLEYAEETLLQ